MKINRWCSLSGVLPFIKSEGKKSELSTHWLYKANRILKFGISVCIISLNEEKNIEKCINSVKGIASEIIVIDTGSYDKTKEVAESLGATVYSIKWDKDFSKARNEALKHAIYSWILCIDCDEEFNLDYEDDIKGFIKKKEYEGIGVKIVNIIENKIENCFVSVRMFRNREDYRFKGSVYEQIAPIIEEKKGMKSIISTDIEIINYEDDIISKDKARRNLEILNNVLEKQPHGYYYFAMGNEYSRVEDYDKALDCYNNALDLISIDFEYGAELYENKANILLKKECFISAISTIDDGLRIYKGFKELCFLKVLCYIKMFKYTKALETIKIYEAMENVQGYPSLNYEEQYDASKVKRELLELSLYDDISLVTTVILYGEGIIETIKSINEISSFIWVMIKDTETLDYNLLNKIKELDIRIFFIKGEFKEEIIKRQKQVNTEYIMAFKAGEIITIESQWDLYDRLQTGKNHKVHLKISEKSRTEIRIVDKNYLKKLFSEEKDNKNEREISIFNFKEINR